MELSDPSYVKPLLRCYEKTLRLIWDREFCSAPVTSTVGLRGSGQLQLLCVWCPETPQTVVEAWCGGLPRAAPSDVCILARRCWARGGGDRWSDGTGHGLMEEMEEVKSQKILLGVEFGWDVRDLGAKLRWR